VAEWVKACTVDECREGQVIGRKIRDKKVFIAQVKGKFYCCDARCTHTGGPLDEGFLDDYEIECPWHASKFDIRTGKPTQGPAVEPIESFKTQVKGKDVLVQI